MSSATKTKMAKAQATTIITPDVKTRIVEYINSAGAGGKYLNFQENNQGIKFSVYMDNENLKKYTPRIGTMFQVVSALHTPANERGTGTKSVPAKLVPVTTYEGQKQQVLNPFNFVAGIVGEPFQPEVNPADLTSGD